MLPVKYVCIQINARYAACAVCGITFCSGARLLASWAVEQKPRCCFVLAACAGQRNIPTYRPSFNTAFRLYRAQAPLMMPVTSLYALCLHGVLPLPVPYWSSLKPCQTSCGVFYFADMHNQNVVAERCVQPAKAQPTQEAKGHCPRAKAAWFQSERK